MLTWTDERVTELRDMCASPERPSAGDMGRELGVSRNAIIGKVLRLGLELPNHGNVSPTGGRRIPGRPRKLQFQHKPPTAPQPPVEPVIEIDDTSDADIPIAQRVGILGLTENTCRWPLWGEIQPEQFYCGAEPIEGRVYCGRHCRRAYHFR